MAGLTITEIQKILPHRYPFLLVDRILELVVSKKAAGIKNVTINEGFFTGHFPRHPVMPGVLIAEAMAQVGGIVVLSDPAHRGKIPYLVGIDDLRFRKPVVPGDQLLLEAELLTIKGSIGKMKTSARVDGQLVAEALMLFALRKLEEPQVEKGEALHVR